MTGRTRKHHTRSRTGCVACKKRHVRCDERHPICTRCGNRGRTCKYPGIDVPLEYGRMAHRTLPGMLNPWILSRLPATSSGGAADPFDSLPIAMPLKSQELFWYFARAREEKGLASAPSDSLVLCTKDADALRCVLLVAGLHFGNQAIGLGQFESTYLHHKIQCIQTVNGLLNESLRNQDSSLVRMIATLCMVEANQGNILGADAHLDGLMTLLEMRRKKSNQYGLIDVHDAQDLLLQRYVLICIREVVDMKRKFVDPSLLASVRSKPIQDPTLQRNAAGLLEDKDGLQDWLHALCLIPYYITATADIKGDIDARDTIRGMRVITTLCDDRYLPKMNLSPVSKLWPVVSGNLPFLRAASRPAGAATGPGPASIRIGDDDDDDDSDDGDDNNDSGDDHARSSKFRTSWASLAICNVFYMQGTLGQWGSQQTVGNRTMQWLVNIVQADLERTQAAMIFGTRSRELWFWKLFGTALCLEALQKMAQQLGHMATGAATVQILQSWSWFKEQIRLWSLVTGIVTWKGAKEALSTIAWPDSFPHQDMAKSIWVSALSGC